MPGENAILESHLTSRSVDAYHDNDPRKFRRAPVTGVVISPSNDASYCEAGFLGGSWLDADA
jgi:hypothetical protein